MVSKTSSSSTWRFPCVKIGPYYFRRKDDNSGFVKTSYNYFEVTITRGNEVNVLYSILKKTYSEELHKYFEFVILASLENESAPSDIAYESNIVKGINDLLYSKVNG